MPRLNTRHAPCKHGADALRAPQEPAARAGHQDPRTTKPRPPYGDQARERWGAGVKRAQTGNEALRPEAARPTQTGKGREADRRRNATSGRARSARPPRNKHDLRASARSLALGHDGATPTARRLRPRRRSRQTIRENKPTTCGRDGRVRERDLCRRSLNDAARESGPT